MTTEGNDPSPPSGAVSADLTALEGMIAFLSGNMPNTREVALWCLFTNSRAKVAAAFAVSIFLIREAGGERRRVFAGVTILLPAESHDLATFEGELRRQFRNLIGNAVPPSDVDRVLTQLQVKTVSPHTTSALVDVIGATPRQSAVLILDAGRFSSEQVELPTRAGHPLLEEDLWVPQMVQLVKQVSQVAEDTGLYVAMIAGYGAPSRPEHIEALRALPCAVALTKPFGEADINADTIQRWVSLGADGQVATAFAEIEAAKFDPQNTALLKAQVLAASGRAPLAYRELELLKDELLQTADTHSLLFIAEVARQASQSDIARLALERAIALPEQDRESLQSAFRQARLLEARELRDRAADALLRRYPDSEEAVKAVVGPSLSARRFEEARNRLEALNVATPFTKYLAKLISVASAPNPDWRGFAASPEVAASVGEPAAVLDGVRAMSRGDDLPGAISLLTSYHWADEHRPSALELGLTLLERSALARATERPALAGRIDTLIHWLFEQVARLPGDGGTRAELTRLLSAEVSGLNGIAIALMDALKRPGANFVASADHVPMLSPEDFDAEFRKLLVDTRSNPLFGLARIDVSDKERSRRFLSAASRVLELEAEDTEAPEFILRLASLAVSVARSLGERGEWRVLRLATGALAIRGEHQWARDLAEQSLVFAAANTPDHDVRSAWLIFADTYQRLGNIHEAAVGLALARSIHVAEVDQQQAYGEAVLAARLARDAGLTEMALKATDEARSILDKVGGHHETNHLHLDCLAFTIRTRELLRGWKPGPTAQQKEALIALATEAISLVERAVTLVTDDMPPLLLLSQLMALADQEGIALAPALTENWGKSLQRQSVERASRLRAHADGDMATLEATRSRLEGAKFASDLAYDSAEARLIAQRALSREPLPEGGTAAFLIEWLTDHSTRNAGESERDSSEAPPDLAEWLSRSASRLTAEEIQRLAPEAAARSPVPVAQPRLPPNAMWMSRTIEQMDALGLDVHLLGLNRANQLVRVSRTASRTSVVLEPPDVFSTERAAQFRAQYPYLFGGLDRSDPGALNEVLHIMRGLGLSIPQSDRPVLLVRDTDLQDIPANLLVVTGDLWGASCGIGSAPSMTWLSAARANPRPLTGRRVAWIPDEPVDGGLTTLALLRALAAPALDRHGLDLFTNGQPPKNLGGSDLALVGGHGMLNTGDRYFNVIADERTTRLSPRQLARMCRNVGVAILTVCHAGRLDGHPFGAGTHGLAHLLLDHGCRAVVAPPWALDVTVMADWLSTFLASIDSGDPVVTSAFKANQFVRARRTHPADHLAMHVFGDPLFSLRAGTTTELATGR